MKWTKEYKKEYMKEYYKKYYLKNKEKRKEYNKEWDLKNKEHRKEYKKEWRLKNKEKRKEYQARWCLKNREHIKQYALNNRDHKNEWQRNRKKTNPYFRIACNLRSAMSAALQGREKSSRTMKIIGCTAEGLFEHLESCPSWQPWMTRENYGRGGWDVDHIIAIARWDENCPLQFALCWDKSNLQPLEHIANLKKADRYEME
jgi:hypothetical protein